VGTKSLEVRRTVKVVYSICARVGGSGIGYTAGQAVTGIHRARLLTRLFASSNAQTEVPAALIRHWGNLGRGLKYLGAKDATGLVYYLESILFDAWTAASLPRCDIFHGWNGMCLRTLRRARQMGTTTVVERASSHPAMQFKLLREEYERWGVSLRLPTWNYRRSLQEIVEADYVTVPSRFAGDSMVANGVPADRLIEIPFGVDLQRYGPTNGTSPHPFRAVFAGQISVRKGVPYLIEAWRRLNWPDAELWLVGATAKDVARLLPEWRQFARVRFISHSSKLASLLQQCNVFVFPSVEEGSALVTYEALACGLPVITTPNAGSVVRDGVEGFIVPIRDAEALAERLQRLREDPGLRAAMGRAAIERARAFTWTAYQENLVEAYRARVYRHPTQSQEAL
jgi:glycosyltransferase involved in cell wall biosynthesis